MHTCTRYEIEPVRRGRATAVCDCGWRSTASLTPGVAASRWDDHARLSRSLPAQPSAHSSP
jgi:hypothetical protein